MMPDRMMAGIHDGLVPFIMVVLKKGIKDQMRWQPAPPATVARFTIAGDDVQSDGKQASDGHTERHRRMQKQSF